MYSIFGVKCFSQKSVFNWIHKLNHRKESIRGGENPAHPLEVSTATTLQCVDQLGHNHRCVMYYVVRAVSCSPDHARCSVRFHVQFHEVCARWMPHQLTEHCKLNRMGLSLQHLSVLRGRIRLDGTNRLGQALGSPHSTRIQMIHLGNTASQTEEFRMIPLANKVILTLFWDIQGILLQKFQPSGETMLCLTARLCGNFHRLFAPCDLDSCKRPMQKLLNIPLGTLNIHCTVLTQPIVFFICFGP